MQFRPPLEPQVRDPRAVQRPPRSDRDCPLDTAGDRCLWHVGGTAGENDDCSHATVTAPPQPLGEARPRSPLLRGPAVEDGTAAGSDLVVVGDMGGIELAVGGPTDVGFGGRLTTVVVPAVQSACGASAARRVHCSPDPSGGRARRGWGQESRWARPSAAWRSAWARCRGSASTAMTSDWIRVSRCRRWGSSAWRAAERARSSWRRNRMMACSSTMGGCPFTVIIGPLHPDVGGDVPLLGDAVGGQATSHRETWENRLPLRPRRGWAMVPAQGLAEVMAARFSGSTWSHRRPAGRLGCRCTELHTQPSC
jgi:hypothetical protein